jgi:hypothetical protein
MTALPRRRRRNTFVALGAGVFAALAAPTLLYVGAKAISNSKAGQNVSEDLPVEQAFPQTPTAMLATTSTTNELTSVTVFVLAPNAGGTKSYDQRGGSIVSVPIDVDTGSGDQLMSLRDAYALGGEDELRVDLQSVTNLTIDYSAVMSGDQFAALLTGLPSLKVDLPTTVVGGDESSLFAAGPASLTAAQAAQIITAKSPAKPERERHPDIDALWSGVAGAIGTGRVGDKLSAASPASFEELAARLMAGPVASRGLVAHQFSAERNPQALDIEELDRLDAILVFASIAPASMTRPATGLTYRIEAPAGYDQQVRKTIGILLAAGGNVVSVDLNATARADTKFLIYDSLIAAAEPKDNPIFGTITIETPDIRLGGIDETLSLGTDYLHGVDLSAPDATSTTVPADSTETTA